VDRQSFAPDFKNINRIQLSGAPALLEIKSGGEYKRGVVTDGKETYALTTYGRIIGINRQTIINDDMDAFTRLPALCARAAADLESDTVYGILTANAALADTIALFDATTHKNYTSSGTAIDVTALGVGRALMRKQTGLEGRPINVRPSFLIVPAAKETLAQQYTSVQFVPAQSSTSTRSRRASPTR
jgi:phage major head subunit gpT-like protein